MSFEQGVLVRNGKVIGGTGTSPSDAGHTIQNESGTDLTQRDTLQFKGGIKATDDSTNEKTVVDGSPTEITWAQYNALSPAEQEALEHTLVTDVPGADGTISADLMTKLWGNPSPSSAFVAQDIALSSSDYDYLMLITNFNTNASTSISTTIAEKGQNILASCVWNGGTQERIFAYNSATSYSAHDAKSGQSVSNTVCIPLAIYGIKKTVTVKFDALARDVSTSASKCMLSDGVTSVEDAVDELNAEINKGSVSVTADGVKTRNQLLNSLYSLIDFSKVTEKSKLNANKMILTISNLETSSIRVYCVRIEGTFAMIDRYTLGNNNSSAYQAVISSGSYSVSDEGATVISSGIVYKFIY